MGYAEDYLLKENRMKFTTFWRLQALELSLSERMFFRDVIRTLQTWEIVKKEYAELELIRKILEAEINILPFIQPDVESYKKMENIPEAKSSSIPCEKTF